MSKETTAWDERAELDAIVYYYATQGWPKDTKEDVLAQPVWGGLMSAAQTRAIQRHRLLHEGASNAGKASLTDA
jgi:hypothetical protein